MEQKYVDQNPNQEGIFTPHKETVDVIGLCTVHKRRPLNFSRHQSSN